MREAVFTVSPNKQYRGIVSPTTPAQHGPVWSPILSLKGVLGKCRIQNLPLWCSKSNAMVAIWNKHVLLLSINSNYRSGTITLKYLFKIYKVWCVICSKNTLRTCLICDIYTKENKIFTIVQTTIYGIFKYYLPESPKLKCN